MLRMINTNLRSYIPDLSSNCWFCNKQFNYVWQDSPSDGSIYCGDYNVCFYWSKPNDWHVFLIRFYLTDNLYVYFNLVENKFKVINEPQYFPTKTLININANIYNLLSIPLNKLKIKIIKLLPFI
jgi:hypothetical protein